MYNTDMEIDREPSIEEKTVVVGEWIKRISEQQIVQNIDPETVKDVLQTSVGAKLEAREFLAPLGEHTNKAKRPGLNEAWGKEKVDNVWVFIDGFISGYEKGSQKDLPKLERSGHKFSGMRSFFGELTGFAAGEIPFERFKENTESRAKLGKFRQIGKKLPKDSKDPNYLKILISNEGTYKFPASFPPGFPEALFEELKK